MAQDQHADEPADEQGDDPADQQADEPAGTSGDEPVAEPDAVAEDDSGADPQDAPVADPTAEPRGEPGSAEEIERRTRAVRAWLRIRLRIALIAVLPSVVLLPFLLGRSPHAQDAPPIGAPPVATWSPPPATDDAGDPAPAGQAAARAAEARAANVSAAARAALEQGDTGRAQLLALVALEDAVTPETLVTAGTVLTPPRPTARALNGVRPPVLAVAFSPDGTQVVTGHRGGPVQLWNAVTGRPARSLAGRGADVLALAFAPDGRTLAIADGSSRVRLVRVRDGAPTGTLADPAGSAVDRVLFSPDGARLVTSGTSGVRLWTVADRRPRITITVAGPRPPAADPSIPPTPAWTPPAAFSPDGRTLVVGTGDGSVALHDPATGRRRALLPTENYTGEDDPVTALAYARNGRRAASGHASGAVDLWDPGRWTDVARLQDDPELGTFDQVGELSFAPDGGRLAIAAVTLDGDTPRYGQVSLTALPLADWEDLPTPFGGPAYGVAFSPDGRRLVTADADGLPRLWQLDAGSAFRTPVRDWPAALCRRAGANLDTDTWYRLFGQAPYRRLCADFPAPVGVGYAPSRPLPQLG